MSEDIDCVFQGLGDRGAIYISNLEAAKNFNLLQQLNIKAVITAVKDRQIQYPKNVVGKHLHLLIEDTIIFPIDDFFAKSFQFIEQARKSTNILIHCHVGASRSVTLAIAYLIKKYHYSLSQVFTLIKRKRSKILPNPGFINILQKFSEQHSLKNEEEKFTITKRSYSRSLSKNREIVKSQEKFKQQNQNQVFSISTNKSQDQPVGQEQQKETKLVKIQQERNDIESKLQQLRKSLISGTRGHYQKKRPKIKKKTSYNGPQCESGKVENQNPNSISEHLSKSLYTKEQFQNESKMSRFTQDTSKELSKEHPQK